MTQNRDMTLQDDSTNTDPFAGSFNLPDAARPDGMAHSRILGNLLGFKNRAGRFVFLESLLDFLTNTKRLPGLDCFRTDNARCLLELRNPDVNCVEHRWVFGNTEQWEADQCCGIVALHKTNWTAGKRILASETMRWAINDRINRLLVLCLPPEDFVSPHEQTWSAVCEATPWTEGRETQFQRLIRCFGSDDNEWTMKALKPSGDRQDGVHEPEAGVVRKQVLAPQVTERYVRLSYLGDVLPWLREKVIPAAEDAGLAQAVAQYIADIEVRPTVLTEDGGAAEREAEIRQKIELEIALRDSLVSALDRKGYTAKDYGKMTDRGAKEQIREQHENAPERSSWQSLSVGSKDASVEFCCNVWFSSAAPELKVNWQKLDIEGVYFAGPSKVRLLPGAVYSEAIPSYSYILSIVDERLRFGTLPVSVMQASLLDNHLAEELAAKVALAFERVSAISAERRCET